MVITTQASVDDLDRKIIHYICTGFYSYADLAKLCKVGRNTIYRRVKRLEETHIIKRKLSALPNFKKLNLSAVIVGLNLEVKDVEKAI